MKKWEWCQIEEKGGRRILGPRGKEEENQGKGKEG